MASPADRETGGRGRGRVMQEDHICAEYLKEFAQLTASRYTVGRLIVHALNGIGSILIADLKKINLGLQLETFKKLFYQ